MWEYLKLTNANKNLFAFIYWCWQHKHCRIKLYLFFTQFLKLETMKKTHCRKKTYTYMEASLLTRWDITNKKRNNFRISFILLINQNSWLEIYTKLEIYVLIIKHVMPVHYLYRIVSLCKCQMTAIKLYFSDIFLK